MSLVNEEPCYSIICACSMFHMHRSDSQALHAFTQSFTSLPYFCLESLKTTNAVPLQYEFDSSNYHDCLWRPLQEEREALSFTKDVCLFKIYILDVNQKILKFESKD